MLPSVSNYRGSGAGTVMMGGVRGEMFMSGHNAVWRYLTDGRQGVGQWATVPIRCWRLLCHRKVGFSGHPVRPVDGHLHRNRFVKGQQIGRICAFAYAN